MNWGSFAEWSGVVVALLAAVFAWLQANRAGSAADAAAERLEELESRKANAQEVVAREVVKRDANWEIERGNGHLWNATNRTGEDALNVNAVVTGDGSFRAKPPVDRLSPGAVMSFFFAPAWSTRTPMVEITWTRPDGSSGFFASEVPV